MGKYQQKISVEDNELWGWENNKPPNVRESRKWNEFIQKLCFN